MKKYINWFAWISLILAFSYGVLFSDETGKLMHLKMLDQHDLQLGEANKQVYPLYQNNKLFGYLSTGESQGYGGPLQVAVMSDTTGQIIETELLKSFETPSFLAKLSNKKYYQQYKGKSLLERFELKADVEAISGATVSSLAIANASREAAHRISENIFHVKPPEIAKKWRLTAKEGIVVVILLVGFLSAYFRNKKLKYLSLFLGLVFIGFLFNASLSLTHFGRVILGYFPDIHTHLAWWLLLAGTLSILLAWGKNLYCNTICPFRATQMLFHQISGLNLSLNKPQNKILSNTPNVLIWLSLIMIFISGNPSLSSYEPFALMFSLKGAGIQWYILPAALIGSLFFSNFFCRFFCPVGGILRWLLKRRKQVLEMVTNYKKSRV